MTEYESWEVLNGLAANLLQQQALFIGSLTAYVVAAHWVGRTLTTFQILFISTVFVILSVLGVQAQLWFMGTMEEIARGIEGLASSQEASDFNYWIGFVALRVALISGALFYMWQVRHPKAG